MELTDFNIVKEHSTYIDKHRHTIKDFEALCPKCNNIFILRVRDNKILKKHNICKSCVSSKHRDSLNNARLYRIWCSMRNRTKGKNKKDFIAYKEKNIRVCDEWANDYLVFKKWALINGYNDCLQIDRIDNDKGYSPNNCRWVTQTVQNRNTRRLRSNNTSGYRGVSYAKDSNKWVAEIIVNRKKKSLGRYKCRLEAAYVRDKYIDDNNLEHTKNFN